MTASQHAEWLSLLEISGPFLSLPVLTRVWPQGIDAFENGRARLLRDAYEEWADNVQGLMPDPTIHDEWVRFVLETALDFDDDVLVGGGEIPEYLSVKFLEHGETLKPDLVLMDPQPASNQASRSPRMVIQILPPGQDLDKPLSGSSWKSSVATRMMELLHALQVEHPQLTLGLLTNGERWMLVYAPKGETSGFISWYASLWFEERLTLRAFAALLGAVRFFGVPDDDTLANLLATSAKDQHEVTDTLGYQVRRAVEILVQAIDRADHAAHGRLLTGLGTGANAESVLYEAALTVMMRLVFLLSAEERKLLPLDDPFYAENYAIYPLRGQLQTLADQTGEEVLDRRYDAWSRTLATFRAVYAGVQHDRLHLPAYGGSLFDPNRFPFLEGRASDSDWRVAAAQPMPISNRTVLHLLDALQVLGMASPTGGRERRRISFRALDIEQIGHVYEGLLDHRAVRTPEPVLGLTGTKNLEPEIPLSELEQYLPKSIAGAQSLSENDALLDYLVEQTGRSRSALKNNLKLDPEKFDTNKLRIACQNDSALYQRVLPFAGVVRDDDFGTPVVIPANSVYVTEGTTRRATGTHYTPRSLT